MGTVARVGQFAFEPLILLWCHLELNQEIVTPKSMSLEEIVSRNPSLKVNLIFKKGEKGKNLKEFLVPIHRNLEMLY
jgi:hypothetical protein